MFVPTLPVLETWRVLRLTRRGRLVPWLGPALRGLAAGRFKQHVCRYPPGIQASERRYCKDALTLRSVFTGEPSSRIHRPTSMCRRDRRTRPGR